MNLGLILGLLFVILIGISIRSLKVAFVGGALIGYSAIVISFFILVDGATTFSDGAMVAMTLGSIFGGLLLGLYLYNDKVKVGFRT